MGSKLKNSKKINVYLFFSAFIVLLLIVFFTDPSLTFKKSGSDFHLNDKDFVKTIKIEGKDTILLEKENSDWLLNEKYVGDSVAVNNLLFAFTRIEVTGMSELETENLPVIKLLIKEKRKEHHIRFLARNGNSLMFKKGSEKIYNVNLPGISKTSLRDIINDDMNYWLDKSLLDLSSSEIQLIRVNARNDWGDGFVIENRENKIILKTLEDKVIPESATDQDKLQMYLSYFRGIYYHSIQENTKVVQRISEKKPEYEIFIEDKNNGKHILRIFPLIHENGERDLFYAWVQMTDSENLFKVNYVYLDLIMQTFQHFTVE